jgi:hypothetical protein
VSTLMCALFLHLTCILHQSNMLVLTCPFPPPPHPTPWHVVDIPADGESMAGLTLSHVVGGLEPDTQYVFWVRPVNVVATGPRGKASAPVRTRSRRAAAFAAGGHRRAAVRCRVLGCLHVHSSPSCLIPLCRCRVSRVCSVLHAANAHPVATCYRRPTALVMFLLVPRPFLCIGSHRHPVAGVDPGQAGQGTVRTRGRGLLPHINHPGVDPRGGVRARRGHHWVLNQVAHGRAPPVHMPLSALHVQYCAPRSWLLYSPRVRLWRLPELARIRMHAFAV